MIKFKIQLSTHNRVGGEYYLVFVDKSHSKLRKELNNILFASISDALEKINSVILNNHLQVEDDIVITDENGAILQKYEKLESSFKYTDKMVEETYINKNDNLVIYCILTDKFKYSIRMLDPDTIGKVVINSWFKNAVEICCDDLSYDNLTKAIQNNEVEFDIAGVVEENDGIAYISTVSINFEYCWKPPYKVEITSKLESELKQELASKLIELSKQIEQYI